MHSLFIDHQMVASNWQSDVVSYDTWCRVTEHRLDFDQQREQYDRRLRAEDHHYVWCERLRELKRAFKNKMALNMMDTRKSRFRNSSVYSIKRIKAILKDIGRMIAQGEAGNPPDSDESLTILNDLTNYSGGEAFARDIFARFEEQLGVEDSFCCECCNSYYSEDEQNYTSDDRHVCDSCRDEYYIYSECMDSYLNRDNCYDVYCSMRSWERGAADDYCTYRYGSNSFHEYDGMFIADYELYIEIAGEDEDNEDYDGRDNEDNITDYHSARRDFQERCEGPEPALGMEIEVYARNGKRNLFDALRQEYTADDLIIERDGSLDGAYGLELITQPMGRKEWEEFLPTITKIMKDERTIAYNEPAGSGYGIHISLSRRHMSPLAEARMSMFMTAAENTDFIRAVAQRASIYRAEVDMGGVEQMRLGRISYGMRTLWRGNKTVHKIQGRGKYCPINWKDNLAEFRIFQSTTNPSSIAKNLDFIWALYAWTKPEAASGSSFNHRDFVTWVMLPGNRKQYPHLVAFLSKSKFYGTNFSPINSSWFDLVNKPVEEEACEPISV